MKVRGAVEPKVVLVLVLVPNDKPKRMKDTLSSNRRRPMRATVSALSEGSIGSALASATSRLG